MTPRYRTCFLKSELTCSTRLQTPSIRRRLARKPAPTQRLAHLQANRSHHRGCHCEYGWYDFQAGHYHLRNRVRCCTTGRWSQRRVEGPRRCRIKGVLGVDRWATELPRCCYPRGGSLVISPANRQFPNYFTVLGPNAVAGSWGFTIGNQTAVIARLVKEVSAVADGV